MKTQDPTFGVPLALESSWIKFQPSIGNALGGSIFLNSRRTQTTCKQSVAFATNKRGMSDRKVVLLKPILWRKAQRMRMEPRPRPVMQIWISGGITCAQNKSYNCRTSKSCLRCPERNSNRQWPIGWTRILSTSPLRGAYCVLGMVHKSPDGVATKVHQRWLHRFFVPGCQVVFSSQLFRWVWAGYPITNWMLACAHNKRNSLP